MLLGSGKLFALLKGKRSVFFSVLKNKILVVRARGIQKYMLMFEYLKAL